MKSMAESEIGPCIKLYISMCSQAKEEIKTIAFNKSGSYYYCKDKGILSEEIVMTLTGNPSAFDQLEFDSDCVFIPDESYLERSDWPRAKYQTAFKDFMEISSGIFGYPIGVSPKEWFILPESAHLAFYMRKQHHKIWDKKTNNWIKINSF